MKPNILWIMTDQQKFNALSCRGEVENMTPNLDLLCEDSLCFENAYTPSPVCGPARSALKTGLYPPGTGVVKNWVPFKDGVNFLPEMVKEEGYETTLVGKLHFYPAIRDYGFEHVHLHDAPYSVYCEDDPKNSEYISWLRPQKKEDPVRQFNEDELSYQNNLEQFISGSDFREVKEHETWWIEQKSVEFLKNRDSSRPFFLYCSFFGPHQPYCPPSPYKEFVDPDSIVLPDSWYVDFKKESEVYNAQTRSIHNHIVESLSEDDCKKIIAQYFGQVKMIDDSVGRILKTLKQLGLYDNTLIIFASDHGDHLAEHGLFFKGQMYDSCAKVPFMIKKPGTLNPRKEEQPVSTIDIFSTLIDYTGAENDNSECFSTSLRPLLENEKTEWNKPVYSIIGDVRKDVMTMLRYGNLKLIRFQNNESPVYELYNLEEDPDEIRDLRSKGIPSNLKNMLDSWTEAQMKNYPW